MRTLIIKVIFFSGILFLAGVSCKRDKTSFANHLGNVIKGNLQADSWRITYFNSSGSDISSKYASYHIRFNGNGELNASNITNTVEGTWQLTNCECTSGELENLELTLHFDDSNIFTALNNTWNFISQTIVKIELVNKNGGNGSDKYLTIERI